MKFLNKLEIEVKILIVALFFFAAFGLFFRYVYEKELDAIMHKGMNRGLSEFLRNTADNYLDTATQQTAQTLLERQLQWEVAAPFIVKTQKDNIQNLMFAFLGFILLLIFFSMLHITAPLKKLAKSVEKIGRGEFVEIEVKRGGALGVLEKKTFQLQHELIDLREKEKIAAIEKTWRDIAKTMAHEIKNPLTPMRLSIDSIEEKAGKISGDDLKKFIQRISAQINNLEELVNKFKSFSANQAANCQSVYLRDHIIRGTADTSSKIKTHINGNAFPALDDGFFKQILLNLYKNSLNAGANEMQIDITQSEHKTQISFTDNGKGIEKEKLDILFLPYITFSENGSGIGLSVVKSLVESMNGKVWAQISDAGGFRIIIDLERSKNGT
jgi:nitrogen fixation/metabolism regulation signal transduction histidine kinase